MEINEYRSKKNKKSIQSRPDLMNTLQQISREISDNNKFQLYHNFLAKLRAVVKSKSSIVVYKSLLANKMQKNNAFLRV